MFLNSWMSFLAMIELTNSFTRSTLRTTALKRSDTNRKESSGDMVMKMGPLKAASIKGVRSIIPTKEDPTIVETRPFWMARMQWFPKSATNHVDVVSEYVSE
jgi:hypothetical protein